MVWPTTITTNASVTKFAWEQGITRKLESGNDFSDLHEGVAVEVGLWLKNHGIPDIDQISNATDFEPAATHLFLSKVLRRKDPDLAELYHGKFLALMKSTRPELQSPADAASSGNAAKVVVIKQGNRRFTTRRSGEKFRDFRF